MRAELQIELFVCPIIIFNLQPNIYRPNQEISGQVPHKEPDGGEKKCKQKPANTDGDDEWRKNVR